MPTPCWLKHICSIRAWVPVSFFLYIYLYFWLIPWIAEACWAHFLAPASKTLSRRHTAACTHSRGRLVPTCSSASPKNRTQLAFHINQGVSASFSLLLSRPPGSSPLKDQQLTYIFQDSIWASSPPGSLLSPPFVQWQTFQLLKDAVQFTHLFHGTLSSLYSSTDYTYNSQFWYFLSHFTVTSRKAGAASCSFCSSKL